MRKRLAIAMVLANRPDMILMDEPFGALDYATKVEMQLEIASLRKLRPLTTMFVTHDVEEAVFLADRVIVMAKGEVIDDVMVDLSRPRGLDRANHRNLPVLRAGLSINSGAAMNSGRAHALRVLFAAIVLAVAWQAGALMVQSSGGPAMRLAPTWQQIILVDLPGMAAFQYGGQESDYGAALWVLATNALATIARVLTSLVLAFILGTALGVITMSNRFARGVLSPIARTARNVPLLALVPLFLIWFGGEEYGVIAFITFGLSVIYLTSTIAAIETVDRDRINFARVLGAKRLAVVWDVILPSIVPNLLDATRVAVGVAFAVELKRLAAQDGLGRLLIVSETYVQTGRMVIILLCYVALASIATHLVGMAGNRLTRWLPRASWVE